jgi:hypothetical protein
VTENEFDVRAALGAAYNDAPVEDDDRREADQDLGRRVIVMLRAPWPHKNPYDIAVKLPLRVVYDQAMGLGLELGPYDFDSKDIHMLKQVIAMYEHHGGEAWPINFVPVSSSNPAATLPCDGDQGNVVYLDSRRELIELDDREPM